MAKLTRRTALISASALAASRFLPGGSMPVARAAEGETESHGLSTFGELALPADFKQLPYVNASAPKGGQIVLQTSTAGLNASFDTFNSFNPFILRGNSAAGLGLIADSLLSSSSDEPDGMYGLAARAVRWSADKLTYTFLLRPEARFHDGSPMTSADVTFSLLTFRDRAHPVIRAVLQNVESVTAPDRETVVVNLKAGHSRDLPLTIAGQPILSKAFYDTHDFEEPTLVSPLGSGPYKIGAFEQGRFVSYECVPDYWGKDLPIRVGQNNFGVIRYEYFRERQTAFEGFKSAVITFREEATSIIWAKGYDFPAASDGRIKRETIPNTSPRSTQGWWFNTRRPQLQDPRIRQAIGFAFDFEWTNTNLMFGLYKRSTSYFQNSDMEAKGKPGPDEMALLEPFRGRVVDTVFGEAIMPPVSDGSGQDRALLAQAYKLLLAAGCKRDGQVLKLPSGEPLSLEILESDSALERHTAPFVKNLGLLGIQAVFRTVDAAQYQARVQNFDFDVTVRNNSPDLTPGEDLRQSYSSPSAKVPGSPNLMGIADPVIDALVEKAVVANSRAELTTICRCIDRILRAGYYGVLMWTNPEYRLAYWDMFDHPQSMARYNLGVLSTWWVDEEKAKKLKLG